MGDKITEDQLVQSMVDQAINAAMQDMGLGIAEHLQMLANGAQVPFLLIACASDADGNHSYVSNMDEETLIKELEALLATLTAQVEQKSQIILPS